MRSIVISPAILMVLAACVPLTLAQGTYTQIDYPGAAYTSCSGIDSAGDIVGFAAPQLGQEVNGFLLSGGNFATITYNGQAAILAGMNDVGQIVGYAKRAGFIYDIQAQTFTKVQYQIWVTQPTAINNAGTVTGWYSKHNNWRSFELTGSTYSMIAPPGAPTAFANGVSTSGEVVAYANRGGYFNFLYAQGQYQRLLLANVPSALVYGINPAGTALVGFYVPSSGVEAGFVFQKGSLQTLQFPGSDQTYAFGINSAGEVVGDFVDSSHNSHCFLWTPPADAAKK